VDARLTDQEVGLCGVRLVYQQKARFFPLEARGGVDPRVRLSGGQIGEGRRDLLA